MKRAVWFGLALSTLVGCRSDLPVQVRNALAARALVSNTPVSTLAHLGTPIPAAEPTALHQVNAVQVEQSTVPRATVVPPPCAEAVMDLETALRRAATGNPTLGVAREVVQVSLAEQWQANTLLLPTLDAGMNFNWHRGNLESPRGVILNVDRQAAYAGAGAAAVGGGTVGFPGVRLTAHLADALFEPLAARQTVTARRFDSDSAQNAILLDVAVRYFELAGAEARIAALRQSENELAVIADLTEKFARLGQGRASDARRAQSEAELLQATRQRAEEEAAVAAAELARLLDLDPSERLRMPGGPIALLQLVDPRGELEPLVQLAMNNHPELQARTADVAVNATRLRKEKVRPWVPFLTVGFSAGGFGGGSNLADTRFGHFDSRTDFDVMAVWSLRNFGLGNLAAQRQNGAKVGEAVAERERVANAVRRAVAEALALGAARLQEVDVGRRRVATAEEAYRLDLKRVRNLEGRPIEVLNSINLLAAARQDLIRAQVGYNQEQFRLLAAIGQSPLGTLVSAWPK